MMRKPVIGITASYSDSGRISMNPAYVDAIRENGGIGCLLSRPTDPAELAALAADLDGLLFAGGDDVDPARYGETISHPSVKITAERDAFELALFAEFVQTGKPILGICRGIQLLNVALGGSLHQHIEGHRQSPTPGSQPVQSVTVEAGTLLARLIGHSEGLGALPVNTFHHQAVKQPGRGTIVSARAADGIIEAIELPDYPFLLGVQWHPELFWRHYPAIQGIFAGFVAACRAKRKAN